MRTTYVYACAFTMFMVVGMSMDQSLPSIKPFLTLPVKEFKITQGWEYSAEETKFHRDIATHYAIDFQAPRGTPVYAAADGFALHSFHTYYLPQAYVDEQGKSHRLGYGIGHFVQIWHPEQQVFTSYCHLDKVDPAVPYVTPVSVKSRPDLKEPDLFGPDVVYRPLDETLKYCKPVKRGQLIGYVGDSGLSDNYEEGPDAMRDHKKFPTWDPAGPHLHFEVYRRNAEGRKNKRWDPYGIYGKAADYASGKSYSSMTSTNLWLLDAQGRPRF